MKQHQCPQASKNTHQHHHVTAIIEGEKKKRWGRRKLCTPENFWSPPNTTLEHTDVFDLLYKYKTSYKYKYMCNCKCSFWCQYYFQGFLKVSRLWTEVFITYMSSRTTRENLAILAKKMALGLLYFFFCSVAFVFTIRHLHFPKST